MVAKPSARRRVSRHVKAIARVGRAGRALLGYGNRDDYVTLFAARISLLVRPDRQSKLGQPRTD
jgi:hypothetical protein